VHCSILINEILDLSRIEPDGTTQREAVSLVHVVATAIIC